jgi:flagellar basal-body rod modification protein FlgD
MPVASIDTVQMSDNQISTPKTEILGKDDFLTLLVTQLQHQDPLNPKDSAEFTAQLAQFSSLEQLGNVNDNLEYLKLALASSTNSQAVSIIGKQVVASGNSIQVNNGGADGCQFELAADTSAVTVNIYDASGNFIKAFEAGALSAGEHALEWDGKDNNGNTAPNGAYFFEVLAVDNNDQMVNVTTFTTGKVTGVSFRNNTTYLIVENQEIPLGDVIKVSAKETIISD